MSKSKSKVRAVKETKSKGGISHRGIPEQLRSDSAYPVQWKNGWSFDRTMGGSVIIKIEDEKTKQVIARTEIPGSDWVKIVGGVSLRKYDDICRGILKVIHS
jgi:hypothetical protein